jgi:glucuronate isomerase
MYITDQFLLETKTAHRLYHEYAADMPIIDYHNHLNPQQIADNTRFDNITSIWLNGDHYKWRAMRTLGIDEPYITGTKSDEEKFNKWAYAVPYTLRNPLYHWTHLELKNYFGINDLLCPTSSSAIYAKANEMLQEPSHYVRGLLDQMKVKVVCTTDDPLDTLEYHKKYQSEGQAMHLLPSFRPDKFILIDNPSFVGFITKLGEITNSVIDHYDDLLSCLSQRANYFKSLGCKVTDHGLEYISAIPYTEEEVRPIFRKVITGYKITQEEAEKYKSAILFDLCKMYHGMGFIQQFHLGAMRNNNLRAMRTMGPDTGWDSISDFSQARALSALLGRLDEYNQLSKTVIYNLNPSHNEVMATMIGNFNDGSIKGKIQFGSGWWFMDQKDGMEKQINALSNMGLLSCFIGMLTDSRSFLSFPRHEYFRRILCNIFGKEIEKGELPNDISWVGKIIQDICYNNVAEYLQINQA